MNIKRLAILWLVLSLISLGVPAISSAQIGPTVRYPGVYIEEIDPQAPIPEIDTAVPAFIGYTERAELNGQPVTKPQLIDSLAAFEQIFGGAPPLTYLIHETPAGDRADFEIGGTDYSLSLSAASQHFYLYHSLRHYFANGGGEAYITSIGTYSSVVESSAFSAGLQQVRSLDRPKPTLLLAPDALLLNEADYYSVADEMLAQSAELGDRFAIIDVYRGDQALSADPITAHRNGLGTQNLRYGASYYPFLAASVVQTDEITRNHIAEIGCGLWLSDILGDDVDGPDAEAILAGDDFGKIKKAIARRMNLLPPGPAIAGVYTAIDETRGVWKSPANVDLVATVAPVVSIGNAEQAALNVDAATGKSVNAIRAFQGRGAATVWGARTLDGNSAEGRYVSVQRTLMMIEEAASQITESYAFSANDATSWAGVKSAMDTYLQTLFREGALQGATPSEAYSVLVGLGSTMTAADIDAGILRAEVLVALTRPAEFMVVRVEQKMAE